MKKFSKLFFYVLGVLLVTTSFAYSKTVEIKSFSEGGYYITIDKKPSLLKGVIYSPTPVGEGYEYDFFSDPKKPWLVDGPLMKDMGINCIRVYSVGKNLNDVKRFIREMYEKFGIYTIVSDWLGLWSYPGANYADEMFREKTKGRLLEVVRTLKDEEGLLLWILGNENNYTFSGKIGFWTSTEIEGIESPSKKIERKAEIYYEFIDQLAQEIKKIDSMHPVVLGNGEATNLDVAARVCKNIDALAIIAYRGKKFGNLFEYIRTVMDKPILFSEFGCDSYDVDDDKIDEDVQSVFLLSQWQHLYENSVFSGNKNGNCIGGVIFEWTDEWWKHNEGYSNDWKVHNPEAGWSNGSYYFDIRRAKGGFNMNEEWFGIIALTEELDAQGINMRVPKKSFNDLKKYFSSLSTSLPK